jgi:hypothetical protein
MDPGCFSKEQVLQFATATDSDDKTASDIAKEKGFKKIEEYLLKIIQMVQ